MARISREYWELEFVGLDEHGSRLPEAQLEWMKWEQRLLKFGIPLWGLYLLFLLFGPTILYLWTCHQLMG